METSSYQGYEIKTRLSSYGYFIVCMYPNKLITRLNVMLREAVNAVVPSGQPSIRSTLTMFLDRGYFEISKQQTGENVTNLIQLLDRLGVRF